MPHKAERGVFELKQGRILCVADRHNGRGALVAPVEGLGTETLAQLRSLAGRLRLVVTAHRGRAMGIDAPDSTADLSLNLDAVETPDTIMGLATDPGTARSNGSRLGFDPRPATPAESAGLALTRFGRLLPAVVVVEANDNAPMVARWIEDGTVLQVSKEEVFEAVEHSGIEITRVAEAPVP
ncbi:MAG: hypothetical protein OEN00_18155, partial [Gemmatimonadota bacterium]|nr:hypothetical protein [Gemmatimonadota bacterium]